MSCCTKSELALKNRFAEIYKRSQTPVMKAVERIVCGCDYGGNSWTTREQADDLIRLLELDTDTRLVDLGAGSGWPAIYLAKESGCKATLVDLPKISVHIAEARARDDGLEDRITTVVADAADLPLADANFDAISHSDLLCCLVQKEKVLEECRRVVCKDGRMVFTVITIVPGLPHSDHARACASAPDFVETEDGYETMLQRTGWALLDRVDLTSEYEKSCTRQLQADTEHRIALEELLGIDETAERIASWRTKLATIQEGLFLRELFYCRPTGYA